MNVALAYKEDSWPNYTHPSTGRLSSGGRLAPPRISAPAIDAVPSWLRQTKEKIEELQQLREDWDGRGSAAVRNDVLTFVSTILTQVMPNDGLVPGIIPLGHGGVQVEWRKAGKELELEIARPHAISGVLFNTDDDTEQEIQADSEHLKALTDIIWRDFRQV